MSQPGPWGNLTGPWSTDEGPWSGGLSPTAPRGSFMGVTGPGVSVSTSYMNGIDLLGPPGWVRAGFPELQDGQFSGSVLSSATLTTITNEVNRVHGHGYNYHYSMLGVPTFVNPAAGTNGNWKYWPTDNTGRSVMAACAVQIAHILVARAAANGKSCAFEAYQEPDIRQFNPGTQSQATWAAAMQAVIDAVRSAEPSLTVIAGSVANRGGSTHTNASDVGWTGDQFIKLALDAQPSLAQAAHAPHYWGYHPYQTNSFGDDGTNEFGTGQMDAFVQQLVNHGCKSPSGGPAKVSVTEYGCPWELYQGTAWTEDDQLAHFLGYIRGFNSRRGLAPWTNPAPFYTSRVPYLGGPEEYYVDFGDNRSLMKDASTPTKAGVEFKRQTLVGAAVPHADFSYAVNGLAVSFTDFTTGTTGVSWAWDFGDGTFDASNAAHQPVHTYAAANDYSVTFTVTDGTGQTDSVTHIVSVNSSGVTPTFNYGPASGVAPLTILASDTTPNSTAWVWDFGDGTPQASTHDVQHVYTAPGVYTLAMFVNVGGGTAATTQTVTVTASSAVPNASFNWTQAGGLVVSFLDLSTGNPTSWSWNFGDGATSTLQFPSHRYATAGRYTVGLAATNANGSSLTNLTIDVVDASADDQVVVVEIGAPPTPRTATNTWVVDDPIRGQVNSNYVIADDFDWIEVTDDLVSIDTERKFNLLTNRMDPGTATIELRNDNPGRASWYDSQNFASPFFPHWESCRIRISVDGSYIFGGPIAEAPITDVYADQMTVTIHATDILSLLNQKVTYKPEDFHNAGQRIHRWLEMVDSTETEFLALGNKSYQKGITQEQAAVEAIGDVAFCEGGMFFASSQGNAYVFLDRAAMASSTYLCTFTDQTPTAGNVLQYAPEGVQRNPGRDLVYNGAKFSSLDDPPVVATAYDAASAALYGSLPLSDFTSPLGGASRNETALWNQSRVNQLVADYKDAHPRFENVVIDGMRYTAAQRRGYVTGLELGSIVRVQRSAPGAQPTTETHLQVIVGLSYHVEPNVTTAKIDMQTQLAALGN